MGEKLGVGPINKGLRTDRKPFAIDNDSFPQLINAYQWRGRIRRKRGTSFLARLTRFISGFLANTGGAGNILARNLIFEFSLELSAQIVPGSVVITIGLITYTDNGLGILVSSGIGSGTINYATTVVTISGSTPATPANITFNYFPDLPVMGLEELSLDASNFPGTIGFDTVYAYNIATSFPYNVNDVSFYKNPTTSGSLPGYIPKSIWTPLTWNGKDYQQFWTTNYQGAFWATNGINVPFNITNIGMQFKPIVTVTVTAGGPPAIATLNIIAHGLVEGDFVFINEVTVTTGINFQTGYVIAVIDANNVSVEFPNATLVGNGAGGIAQYLTNRSDVTKDVIRWYDGDPTDGNSTNPTFLEGKGWVNFMPPLSLLDFSIADTPAEQYYLVGARIIQPFKDRLCFIGPVIQTSSPSAQPIYLPDTVIYSQNGTPFYTASFTGDPSLPTTIFNPILVPVNQTATAPAYWGDQTGFGGFAQAGVSQAILTCTACQDVLILGAEEIQMRFVYSGNDILPFNFFLIDSELSTGSTFSAINMGHGAFTRGDRGIVITTQTDSKRVDDDILDQVMEMDLTQNGAERITAQRDYLNEWIYLTYVSNQNIYKFPTQTLQWNYRENSWGIFNEAYTTYGQFRKQTGFIWSNVGTVYPTWSSWTVPWNAGSSTLLAPEVIAGNQQGFIVVRDDGTNESNSLYIASISFPATITNITKANPAVITAVNQFAVGQQITISGVVGMVEINGLTVTITSVTPTTITIDLDTSGGGFSAYVSGGVATPLELVYSPNHCLNEGDYFVFSGILGTLSILNGKIFSVGPNPTVNGFSTNPTFDPGTYLGGGLIKRMYVPYIQTKQFPSSWAMGRKTRVGVQQYLLSTTDLGQITLLIFLSQNSADAFNIGNIVPGINVVNGSLIYSTVLFTCPESTNLGLTPANTNLQMIVADGVTGSAQLWHRVNTSLIGDTIQFGFTMSDAQMRDPEFNNQFEEIEIHGFNVDISPSQVLA